MKKSRLRSIFEFLVSLKNFFVKILRRTVKALWNFQNQQEEFFVRGPRLILNPGLLTQFAEPLDLEEVRKNQKCDF